MQLDYEMDIVLVGRRIVDSALQARLPKVDGRSVESTTSVPRVVATVLFFVLS